MPYPSAMTALEVRDHTPGCCAALGTHTAAAAAINQGLTPVQSSAQPEPFPTQNTQNTP